MASGNETVADIVREMRGPYYKMGRSNASLDKQMMDYMSFIANRIEAAHKRELAAKDDERLTIVANYEIIIADKDAKIARLRECLAEPKSGAMRWKERIMKASEMTNEELAKALMSRVPLDSNNHDDIREAAARLRNATVREMAHRASVEAYRCEVKDLNSKRHATICDLRRRLKVAEDALTELQARCVAGVYDGTTDPYEALKIAEDALAAIREKGANNGK